MSSPVSSLPEAWVERIWTEMRATYGASFDRQWQCPEGVEPADHVASLKAVWGRELARFQQNPKALSHALAHLPERPPNLVEFRALCGRAPVIAQPALPAPKADPSRVAKALERVSRIATERHPRQWAHDLKAREEAGENLSALQQSMWREALRDRLVTDEREAA